MPENNQEEILTAEHVFAYGVSHGNTAHGGRPLGVVLSINSANYDLQPDEAEDIATYLFQAIAACRKACRQPISARTMAILKVLSEEGIVT